MKLYELVNPSDPYTFEAESEVIAGAVALGLGDGKYPADQIVDGRRAASEEEGDCIPCWAFDKDPEKAANKWFEERCGKGFNDFIRDNMEEIATALDSVLIGSHTDRKIFEAAMEKIDDPEKQKEFRDEWHDKKRSSMNDIGGYAWKLAESLRKKASKNKQKEKANAESGS